MPSVFSHAVAALGIGACFYRPGISSRVWLAGAVCSMVPDIDVVGFHVGIHYGDFLGHRGFTHSLFFAALLAGVVLILGFAAGVSNLSRVSLWTYLFLATASHGFLDAMTDGGLGVAFFAPFDTRADVAKSILGTLRQAHAPKVYGFVNAKKLEQYPEEIEVLKLWREAGFPLGNHTYSHLSLNDSSADQFDQNVAADESTLKSLMDHQNWHWFRYPYLWEGDTLEKRRAVRQYLKDHKYHIAQVTLDFEDYLWNVPYARCAEKNDAASIDWLKSSYMSTAAEYIGLGQQMAKLVYGRDIRHVLLLHIGAFDAVMLPQLLDFMKKQGFKFVTLAEAEKDPALKVDPDMALKDGGTLLEQMMEAKHINFPQNEKPYDKLNAICR